MQIEKIEDVDVCKSRVYFSIDKSKIDDVVFDIAKDIAKSYKVPGYRKGKATIDAVKVKAKKHILEQASQRLLSEAFEDILFEKKWLPFGEPKIDSMNMNYNSCQASLIVGYAPEFELNGYKGLEFKLPKLPSEDDMRERMIESIKEQFGDEVPFDKDDFVLMEDLVVVDYIGKLNGEDFKNNVGKDVAIKIGSNAAVAGFEDKLIGMKVGETTEFDIDFGEDFSVKAIAGKTITFVVTLKEAKRKKATEINEALFKKLQIKDMEHFNEMLATEVKNQMDISKLSALRNDVVVRLLEINPINIPDWMAGDIAKSICKGQKLEWATLEQDKKDELLKNSADKIKLSFIINKIKDNEPEAALSSVETSSIMNNNLGRFPENIRNQLLNKSNPYLYAKIASEIQDEHVIKWIVNNAVLVEDVTAEEEPMAEMTTTEEEGI